MSAELWTIEEIASFLKKSKRSVYSRVITVPDFPKAIRLPSEKGKRAHPLWFAKEVIDWVMKYQR